VSRELVTTQSSMKLGDFEVHPLLENVFHLDGGTMFGVVPKVLWSKLVPADENNLITMHLNLLLVKTREGNVLIDTGLGDSLSDKMKKIYGLKTPSNLESELGKHDLKPEDITHVIFTHLHVDHSGGAIKVDSNGDKSLRFPNAKHYAQVEEWEDATHPNERTAATYLSDNMEVLGRSGLFQTVDGDVEVTDGIRVWKTGGHTPGHQAVVVESEGETLIYPADIIPMSAHLKAPYIAGVDLDPLGSMERKKEIIEHCVGDGWYLAFDHDVEVKIARLHRREGKIEVEKIS
jgi:glyoxylase-like metal-dependent hydrolase (beta-lactamase superfamily II)